MYLVTLNLLVNNSAHCPTQLIIAAHNCYTGVLEIDTDLGNLFSLALLPPCEIEIPAGNLGTLFGAAFDAGSL